MIDLFMSYSWRGNIRELENVVERAVLMAENEVLKVFDLPEEMTSLQKRNWGDFFGETTTLREARRRLEKEMIQRVLVKTGGDKKKASESLGITLRSLQYKIKEYQIGK